MTENGTDPLTVHLAGPWWVWRDMAVRAAGFPAGDLLGLGRPALAASADAGAGAGDPAFRAAYQAAIEDSNAALADIVQGDSFRAAMVWQNRELNVEVLDRFLAVRRAGGARNAKQRHRETVLTKYVQRYHARNESVGFFGPVGWARWAAGGSAPGPGPGHGAAAPAASATGFHGEIAARRAHVETWAVQALAERFAADPLTRPWLRPVVSPTLRVRDGRVRTPLRGWFTMPRPRSDVLAACDGHSTVSEIAGRLVAGGTPGIASADDVERHLAALERAGYVRAGFGVPLDMDADRQLRDQLACLPDAGVRDQHLTVLDGILAAADRVRNAGPGQLGPAFADLERRFTDATGLPAYRTLEASEGAGRGLMLEDCRSTLSISLQPSLLADLAGPLDLLLASSRWLTGQIAARYLQIAGEIFDGLVRPGTRGVGLGAVLAEFLPRCAARAVAAEATPLVAEFQRRWAAILGVPPGAARHRVRAVDIAGAVRQEFAAASAPWLSGRFHCPDILIAAADVESICRGDYTWVLGEMHCGAITLNQPVFVVSHPDRDRMQAMADQEASRGRWLIPSYSLAFPGVSGRNYPPPFLISPGLEYVQMSAAPPRAGMAGMVIAASDLLVVRGQDGTLWIEDEDDAGRRWPALALLGEFLIDGLPNQFRPMAPAPHQPRVAIDRFVFAREQWQVPAGDLAWPGISDEADRFRGARRWAHELGLPDHVFVRLPWQPKPFYIDLTSPLLVNMLASVARCPAGEQAQAMCTISEMYPGPGELWLPHGPGGGRCTSELRFAIVDRGA